MKIAIVSDSHDQWDNLEKVVKFANEQDCEYLLHAGDLISPPGVTILQEFKGKVIFVFGNNEGEKVGLTRKFDSIENLELKGTIYEGELGGVKIHMNHYPEIGYLAAKSGEYDLVIYGHDHTYYKDKVNNTLLVNPGALIRRGIDFISFLIFDTETKNTELIKID